MNNGGKKRAPPKSARSHVTSPARSSKRSDPAPSASNTTHWTYLTNHTHVLVILSRDPSLVLRKVAVQVGITERAVQRIIADLETAGVIERAKVGRRNHYRIHTGRRLRHANEAHRTIGELLELINRD